MGSGGVLGTSGGQETTREAPKTIFAAEMGAQGLQKGSKMESKCYKNRCKILLDFRMDFLKEFCLLLETFGLPK